MEPMPPIPNHLASTSTDHFPLKLALAVDCAVSPVHVRLPPMDSVAKQFRLMLLRFWSSFYQHHRCRSPVGFVHTEQKRTKITKIVSVSIRVCLPFSFSVFHIFYIFCHFISSDSMLFILNNKNKYSCWTQSNWVNKTSKMLFSKKPLQIQLIAHLHIHILFMAEQYMPKQNQYIRNILDRFIFA